MENVREKINVAQDMQKSCVNRRRKDLHFNKGVKEFLNVSPTKGVICFGKRGKLRPRYMGPIEILERVGELVYRLILPPVLL